MSTAAVTPIFDPQGNVRSIPADQVQAALSAGGKIAVQMKDPQGTLRYVPNDMVDQAKQAGGSLADQAVFKAAPPVGSWAWFKEKGYEAADTVTNALPAAGGTIGGILGAGGAGALTGGTASPVGAIGGAGLGGMAGEAVRQSIRQALGFDAPTNVAQSANNISKQGLIQGGVQAASEALPLLAGPLKSAAESQFGRALAPTTRANKAITQDVVPDLIDRGVHGSLPSIADQAGNAASAIRPQLNAAYSSLPASATQGAGDQIMADLEKTKAKYIVNGLVAKPQAVDAITGVQNIVQQYGSDIAPDSLRKLKQIFDLDPAAKNAYSGADLATQYTLQAQKAAANSIRSIVHQASPDIAALDKEISFWLDVQRVASASANRQTGQSGGLVKTLLPLAGAGAVAGGSYVGGAHAGLEAAGAVALTGLATKIVRSPAWQTASAVTKDALADALSRGDVGSVASLATRLGVAATLPSRIDAQSSPTTQ